MELSTSRIVEENLVQSTLHQTLGDEFTFQQDNNLTRDQIYTEIAYQEGNECSSVAELALS